MPRQLTHTLFMIRPANFGFNAETALNNAFQDTEGAEQIVDIREKAKIEFDAFVSKLRNAGIQILVGMDGVEPAKPDAIFPNNWISFHEDGSVITYPMYAVNRRIERDEQYIHTISHSHHIKRRYDFEMYEDEGMFLEGTGSMVLDRENRTVYACLSERTDLILLDKWCVLRDYKSVVFHAADKEQKAIYHTNVMMALGTDFVVICLDSIIDLQEKEHVLKSFSNTRKNVIDITLDQIYTYVGNMLQVKNSLDEPYIIMSEQAYKSLRGDQILELEKHGKLLFSPIYTIEKYGGGSARCMMAEVFLNEKLEGKDLALHN